MVVVSWRNKFAITAKALEQHKWQNTLVLAKPDFTFLTQSFCLLLPDPPLSLVFITYFNLNMFFVVQSTENMRVLYSAEAQSIKTNVRLW